ncbi:MAG: hypothetical protein ABIT07_08920 [Ferruginibacter sp.]
MLCGKMAEKYSAAQKRRDGSGSPEERGLQRTTRTNADFFPTAHRPKTFRFS